MVRALAALTGVAAAAAQSTTVSLTLGTTTPQHTTASPFLAYNLDTGSLYNSFDLTEPKLHNLLAQLGPTIIRIGGTAADYSWYLPNDPRSGDGNAHTIINNTVWDNVIDLVTKTNTRLMWDFNSLSFRKGGFWDPSGNATAQLDYLESKYKGKINAIWTTGNEPDLWPSSSRVDAKTLATDAITLAKAVAGRGLGEEVYGPAWAGFNSGAQDFMTTAKQNPAVTGLTVHNYPLGGHSACYVADYLNSAPSLRKMGKSVAGIAAAKAASGNANMVLTLEETGGSYQGGCPNITDRYLSGFWYLAAMGEVAYNGMDRLHRQDLAGWSFTGGVSNYQLAGPPGWVSGADALMPHPDYYTAILHKMLAAPAILSVTRNGPSSTANMSLYAWCGTTGAEGLGGVTLVYTNPTGDDVQLDVAGSSGGAIPPAPRVEFLLTSSSQGYAEFAARRAAGTLRTGTPPDAAPPATLQADEVYLNGDFWTVDPQSALLPAYPVPGNTVSDPSSLIVVPPYSYGFIVLTSAAASSIKACANV